MNPEAEPPVPGLDQCHLEGWGTVWRGRRGPGPGTGGRVPLAAAELSPWILLPRLFIYRTIKKGKHICRWIYICASKNTVCSYFALHVITMKWFLPSITADRASMIVHLN